jgi:homoserine dehydrogenase
MTRSVSILHLGIGRVGAAALALIEEQALRWRARYDFAVRTFALADSTAFALPEAADGSLTPEQIGAARAARASGSALDTLPEAAPADLWPRVWDRALASVSSPGDVVVLDCSTGHGTTPLLLAARAAGAHVVLANKDPLTASFDQFTALRESPHGGSLRLSATVGAGLPVAPTLAALVASGDTLLELGARASGSLGFLCDQLSGGVPFDAAVRAAEAHGYTEPDPRQDLSGFDVARKLLILARSAGLLSALGDVRVENLVPPSAAALPVEGFRAMLSNFAPHLSERAAAARAAGRVLRYVGRIAPDGALSASLLDLPPDDPLARGHGPDNVFLIRTARYNEHPLMITGPGAGIAVTAGAVAADLLRALGGV